MNELQGIAALEIQVKQEIKKAEEKLRALELVKKMMRDSKHPSNGVPVESGAYKKMKQRAAIQDVLRRAGKKLSAAEVAEALRSGGYKFKSKEPNNSIYVTLKGDNSYVSEKYGSR